MASTHPVIPTLQLSGTPAQIGAAHGESQRDRIRSFIDRFLGHLLSTAALPLTEEKLWDLWAPQVACNQREAPALVEEIHGIARGAGVSFERVFLLNSMLDINCLRYFDMAKNFAGCSTFAVVAEAGTGKTLLGQTYDMSEYYQDYLTLFHLKPAQGPRQLVLTFAGVVGAAGLNEAGIGVNINYLSPTDVGAGKLHSIVVRQILAATNLADALTPPVLPPRAGGAHYLVADPEGNVVSIETTARRYWAFHPEGNAIGHTNHYLAGWLKEVEYIRYNSIGSSLARYAALRRFIHERGDRLTVEALKELTRDHTSYPRSICAHPSPVQPAGTRNCTVAAMVQVPADRIMHVTAGCACANDYAAVVL